MDGERMNNLYVSAILGQAPNFKSEEEESFYNKVKKEIDETPDVQWTVPSE